MTTLPAQLDFGVAIRRVRVVDRATAPTTDLTVRDEVASHTSDCRIIVEQLLIETDPETTPSAAACFGAALAIELATELQSLQQRRLAAIARGRSRVEQVRVRCVHLRASCEDSAIRRLAALATAVLQRRLAL